jgi:copper chaperone NosL
MGTSAIVFAWSLFSGVCDAQKHGEGKMQAQSTTYTVPEEKKQQWESMKNLVEKEYNVCVEHCGNDKDCLDRCEAAYKARLHREYQRLSYQGGGTAVPPDIAKHPSCPYCGMDRAKFSHSRVYIEYDDGSTFGACSLHCAAIDMAVHIDKGPKFIGVGDYISKKLLDAETATWVIGGNKMGVMSKRGKWAFQNKEDADRFIQENGGKQAGFEEAIKAAYEDMYEDTKMIRERRKEKRMKMMKPAS